MSKRLRISLVVALSLGLSSCFDKKSDERGVPSDVSAADKAAIESVTKESPSAGAKLVIADSSTENGPGRFYIASNLPDGTLMYVILKSKENPALLYRYSTTLINHLAPIFNPKLAQVDQPTSGKYVAMVTNALSKNQDNPAVKSLIDSLPNTTEKVDPLFVDVNRKVYAEKEVDI